jgi:hypothetical protein
MSKRNNLKPILIVLGGLVAILALIQFLDKKSERSFKEYVTEVDTTKVNIIEITAKGEKEPAIIEKDGENWMVSLTNKKVQADEESVKEILKEVAAMKAQKVASTSETKWKDLQVTDSTATRVTIKNGKKVLADFYSGKFSYDRNTRQMASYVRNVKEDETYAVEGYMSMMFNRAKGGFRENSVMVGNPDKWKKIAFSYPADSSFTLEKSNGHWTINGMPADSVKVQKFFSKSRMLTSEKFDDATEISPSQMPEYTVSVESETGKGIEVKGYLVNGKLEFTSSLSQGNVFTDDKIAQVLLTSSKSFLP